MGKWTTVFKHRGYEILHLDVAEIGDCMDYKVSPPLHGQEEDCYCLACTHSTVGAAVAAIDTELAR